MSAKMHWKRKSKPYNRWSKVFAIFPVRFKNNWVWLECYEVCRETSFEHPDSSTTFVYNSKRRHPKYGEFSFWSMMGAE